MATNFPKKGDDKKVSLRNSEYERFPLEFAQNVKEQTPEIWRAGGNIEGNRSFRLLEDHIENGTMSPTIEKKIRERESWTARHEKDGSQFIGGKLSPSMRRLKLKSIDQSMPDKKEITPNTIMSKLIKGVLGGS